MAKVNNDGASRTLSVFISANPDAVYGFAANPENLPLWAGGLCKSVRRAGTEWIVETPAGEMRLNFTPHNDFRVLDHYVYPDAETEIYVPMRVLANQAGSEVIFTLFQVPGMSDEKYAEDMLLVQQDLQQLKKIVEQEK
jgi:hypothetical protein